MRTSDAMTCVLVISSAAFSAVPRAQAAAQQQSSTPSPTAPGDTENVRAEIRSLETVLTKVPDRGATLFLLARHYAHLGDLKKALALLKECVALDAGLVPDPDNSPSLRPLETNPDFRELLAQARHHYSSVHKAHIAYTVPAEDLFPEGLAVDPSNGLFYLGMHRKKIVKLTLTVSDFVKQDVYDLSPVGGVHVDPADHSVWAATEATAGISAGECISSGRGRYPRAGGAYASRARTAQPTGKETPG